MVDIGYLVSIIIIIIVVGVNVKIRDGSSIRCRRQYSAADSVSNSFRAEQTLVAVIAVRLKYN